MGLNLPSAPMLDIIKSLHWYLLK